MIVHGLAADEAKVKASREAVLARGLGGVVTVERWTTAVLPYADNLVNALIAEEPGAVPDAEIVRVLAPNGMAWVQRGGRWSTLRKAWPQEYDEWTHGRHGADGNMVSQDAAVGVPVGLRWVAGPAQDAGGKKWYYDHVLVSANGRNFYFTEEGLTARDSFNGVRLWTRVMKAATFKEVGSDVPEFLVSKTKPVTRVTKVKPIATAERIYVAAEGRLLALDAATGKTAVDFGPVTAPREILLEGGTIVLSEKGFVRAFDVATKAVRWETALEPERMVAGDGGVFCMSSNVIACFDLTSGQPRWRKSDPLAAPASTCTYHQGVLVLEKSSWRDEPEGSGVVVYSGQDGRLLWQRDVRPDMNHYKEARAFFAEGLVWLQMQTNRVVGFDPQTGKEIKSWGSRGKHCATPVATERFFIAPECEFTDLATGSRARARMFKSACRLPFIPANGLLYSFPVQCECYPMLRGYMGLASATTPVKAAKGPRLEKGPAFGRAVKLAQETNDWPMYRHDASRSGSTSVALRDSDLRPRWSMQVAQPPQAALAEDWKGNPFVRGLITPPVAAGGTVFVAVPDEHRVIALDAGSGAQRWVFTAGGRIDTPPTISEGLCLFGAHDGWIYCLDATDGELVWRFRTAPQEARIMAYGQMESPWPVPGSVLVDGGVAYVSAGRHPMSDGGVHVLALKPRTGQIVWEKTVDELVLKRWYDMRLPNKKKVGLDFEPMDMLVKDGEAVAMSRWRFNRRNGSFKLDLASAEYLTSDGLAVPRGLWGYGIRQNKSVESKPPGVFDRTKVYTGTTNEVALLLADGALLAAKANGELKRGGRSESLGISPVPDGMIVAGGRLFVSGQNGRVACFE